MHRQAIRNWCSYQLALNAAKTSISTLARAGVRALPVKGVLLAQQLYDPSTRPIADVDLLVQPRDLRRSLQVARSCHWEEVWDSKTIGNVNFVVDGVAIDVACSFGPPGVAALSVSKVLARAALVEKPLGFPHWQIEKHDHALLIAIDAFKDKLGRGKPWAREDLCRVCDVQGFSSRTLVERARAAQLVTMLWIVAEWTLSVGPSPAWESIRAEIGSAQARSRYQRLYARLLEKQDESSWHRFGLSALTRAISDGVAQRALALGLGAVGTAAYVVRHGRLSTNAWRARDRG